MIILGVDGGLSGALAVIDGGASPPKLIDVLAIPTMGVKAKRRVNVPSVLSFLQTHQPQHAYIERAQAMPRQGSSSGFNYGRAIGAIEACVLGMGIPTTWVEASSWKKAHGLSSRLNGEKLEPPQVKELSRQRALCLFPSRHATFALKNSHNLAEAALIAVYGATSGNPSREKKLL